ncbi:unnamed protein product [Arctia plantaginis]|uniref:Uncharacterized protein n=1 Tax=Arctia plantaginis TaxID=874455 RepID=A0A8S1BF68_ARCPL|nr:unnamed protein product [Arctia plantaginis]
MAVAKCLLKKNDNANSECTLKEGQNLTSVKLPVIKLPSFDGSYDKWLEFRNSYLTMIHKHTDLDPVQKFHYEDVYRDEISLSLSRLPSDRFELPNQLSSRQDLAGHGCAILVEYKMGSRQHLNQDEIASMLENDDDYSPLDSDSEQEDCLVEDDVRSDNEDAMVDFIENTSPTSRQDDPENHVASLES